MPRFIAVHTMPWTEDDINTMRKQERPEYPPGVIWKQTYCGFADNKFFCEWEAPNKEVIEQIFAAQKMPFDTIYPVRLYDVVNDSLET